MGDIDTPGLAASVEAAVENAKAMKGPDLVLFRKLFTLQCEMGKIAKTAKNNHTHSSYFDINGLLDVLMPLMQERQLLLMQPLEESDSGFKLLTMIMDTESGATLSHKIKFPASSDPQNVGSSLTYFRRYCLQSLLAIVAEDDDGNQKRGKQTSTTAAKPDSKTKGQQQGGTSQTKPANTPDKPVNDVKPPTQAEIDEVKNNLIRLMEYRKPASGIGVDEKTFWITVTTSNNVSYNDMHKAWKRLERDLNEKKENKTKRVLLWIKKAEADFGQQATGEPAEPDRTLPF